MVDQYRVLTRLRRNGTEYPVGEVVTLPPDEALALVRVGVLAVVEPTPLAVPTRRGRGRSEP